MITILKIPVYLSIETDVQDRSKVTKLAQTRVIPRIIANWQTRGFSGMFDSATARAIDKELGNNDWKLLTDVQAMADR